MDKIDSNTIIKNLTGILCGTIRSLNAIFGISSYGNRFLNVFGSSTSTSW